VPSRGIPNVFIYSVFLVAVIVLFFTAFPQPPPRDSSVVTIGEVAAGVGDGSIRRISVSDSRLQVEFQDGRSARARMDSNAGLTEQLRDYGVTSDQLQNTTIVFLDPPQFGNWLQILFNLLPLVFFGSILLYLLRRTR